MIEQEALLEEFFPDRPDAIELIGMLGTISQTWDDLIDGDKPVSPFEINEAFSSALMLGANPCFRQYQDEIMSRLDTAIADWYEANWLEAQGELSLYTYTLRSAVTPLVKRLGYLILGRERGFQFAIALARMVFTETHEQYQNSVHQETQETWQGPGNGAGAGAAEAVSGAMDPIPAGLRSV